MGVVDLAVVLVGAHIAPPVRLLLVQRRPELRLDILRNALALRHPQLLRLCWRLGRVVVHIGWSPGARRCRRASGPPAWYHRNTVRPDWQVLDAKRPAGTSGPRAEAPAGQ